ncbi:MAG TPA: VCBS repeat-containing protein [Terracidiphilus sp.]|jgi:hypothetical protein|nr:VCBS repeat-containing protein [Terracidiphilus sp.]
MASPLADSPGVIMPGLEMRPALPAGSYPTAVVTGDFNRDGHLDFVVANGDGNDLWIYFGKGDGTFELPRIVPLTKGNNPVFLAAADLRRNGILDLVVAEFGSSTVGVLLGNGDGTFAIEKEYALPEPPGALAVADFNHDGKLGITAVMVTYNDPGPGTSYIAMLAGNGDGTFANPVITNNWGFASTAFDVDAADVNGDGLPDLLITGPEIDNSTIYLNNGDGTFREGPLVVGNGDFNAVVGGKLVDVNGDGCPDAIVADVSGVIWVSLGDCAGYFGPLGSVLIWILWLSLVTGLLIQNVPVWASTSGEHGNVDGNIPLAISSFPETIAFRHRKILNPPIDIERFSAAKLDSRCPLEISILELSKIEISDVVLLARRQQNGSVHKFVFFPIVGPGWQSVGINDKGNSIADRCDFRRRAPCVFCAKDKRVVTIYSHIEDNPRSLGIDDRLSIQQRGFSSIASLCGLPSNNQKSQEKRPGGYSIRPCKSVDPRWVLSWVLMGFVCILGALVAAIWGDHSLWTTRVAIIGMFCLAVFCIAGHVENCPNEDNEQDQRPVFRSQSCQHNSTIVPHKYLDSI